MKSFSNKNLSFRRRLLWGTGFLSLVGSLAVMAASCGTLPDITDGQCGNYVVEPKSGEACDEEVTGKCGSPISYAPCQFICNDEISCAPGYGCGLDGVCRRSGGLSESPISIGAIGAQQLLRGDFDGDGRYEIVAANGNVATVHFLTTEGFVSASRSFPYTSGTPVIGDLDGDGLDDMVLSLESAVAIWLGQEDRTLIPQTHPIMYAKKSTQRLIPLGTYLGNEFILALTDVMGPDAASFIQFSADGGHKLTPVMNNGLKVGKIHGTVATKAIKNGQGKECGLTVVEFEGVIGRVTAGQRCEGDSFIDPVWEITLDAGNKPWAGVYLRDIDNDGADELLYGVDTGFYQTLLVDELDANGKPALAPVPYLNHEPGNCMNSPAQLASVPLAIADLNGDGHVDFVDSRGVLLSNSVASAKPYQRFCHSYAFVDPMAPMQIQESWTSAVVGDINGDGIADLIAARKNENRLDWWTWKPDGLATVTISVAAPMQDLVAGDLDGDTITDVAFRIVPPPGDTLAPTSIYAMFGNSLALPSVPQSVGAIRGVKQLVISRFQGQNQLGDSDLYDDLLILADEWAEPGQPATGEAPLTLIQGNPARTLVAPLLLQENTRQDLDLGPGGSTSPDREISGMVISDFGLPFEYNDPLGLTPSNIVIASGKKIWTAGFNRDGSSVIAKDNLELGNLAILMAPVDDLDTSTTTPYLVQTTKMALFEGSMEGPGLRFMDQIGTNQFTDPTNTEFLDPKVRLPSAALPKAPNVFADLDADGKRDLVMIGEAPMMGSENPQSISIYWAGSAKAQSVPFDLKEQTVFYFEPTAGGFGPDGGMGGAGGMGGMAGMMGVSPIQDIAALNYDDDVFLELAILTREGIYIAKLDPFVTTDKATGSQVVSQRMLQFLNGGAPIARALGGEALVTIDANSDGIDDLVLGEPGKLLLFFGAERLQ